MGLKRIYKRLKPKVFDAAICRGYRHRIPDDIIIETTNVCSLACSCCPNGIPDVAKRARGRMSRETFDRILTGIDVPIKRGYLHMCGEPFLCPDLPYFARRLNERGITAVIFSNGYKIDRELLRQVLKLKKIQISFSADLLSESHYESLRKPAKYETMLEELDAINEVFTECNRFYGLNVIMDPTDVDNVELRCEELFGRYSRLNSISLNSQWPWPKLSKLGDLAGHMYSRKRLCTQAKSSMAVLWNGDVAFCASDYCGDTIVGNLLNNSYKKIFNNRKSRRIRRALLRGREDLLPMCSDCAFPQYEAMVLMVYRNKFLKAGADERPQIFRPLQEYYDLWK